MNAQLLTRVSLVSGCLCCASMAIAKQVPQLSKDQRTLLQAVVAAVDAAATQPATSELTWPTHVMRASDGSHYVAFSVQPPASMPLPSGPVLLYVRLATSSNGSATAQPLERSALREWLAGSLAAPPPPPNRGIVAGEMPAMGATGNLVLRNPNVAGSTDLQLFAIERARAREQQEKREQQRRAELQGEVAATRDQVPFEDFDLSSRQVRADGARIIERALTAGPGAYTLYVGWADPAAPNPAKTVRVLARSLSLAAATTTLSLSSVIVADAVRVRAMPYAATEQASHPYSIGLTEIQPAPDSMFTSDENLAIAFQVINPKPSDTGKPDLEVGFRVVRLVDGREQEVAALTPQVYNADTMPAAFDLRVGHPVLAAMSAPLATLNRGSYRLKIVVKDKNAGQAATTETDFAVTATPKSLLREAPPFAPAFRREALTDAETRSYLARSLRPASASPALTRALDHAAAGRFVELLVEESVPDAEQGVRVALTALARLAVGDTSSAIQFQRAQLLGAPIAPARFLAGAARAMEGRDADAIAAWEEASAAGAPKNVTASFLLDAYLRRSDFKRAIALVDANATAPSTPRWSRSAAGARVATGNYPAAIATLEGLLAGQPDDADALWLWLHATYAQLVSGAAPESGPRDRFIARGQAYVDAKGPNADLVRDWLSAVRVK